MSSKVVLITGANRGLGFCIASVAAKREPSTHFILACRSKDEGVKAAEQLTRENPGTSFEALQLDVTDDDQIQQAVETVTAAHGKLDVLVNNAGFSRFPADQSLAALCAAFRDIYEVNVASVACVSAGFKPLLARAPHPKVINISSWMGSITNSLTLKMPRFAPYGSSKTALNGMTAQLQAMENDEAAGSVKMAYYLAVPGFLKTAFTRWNERGTDPMLCAEVVARLIVDHDFPPGTQWECVDGKMQQVP